MVLGSRGPDLILIDPWVEIVVLSNVIIDKAPNLTVDVLSAKMTVNPFPQRRNLHRKDHDEEKPRETAL